MAQITYIKIDEVLNGAAPPVIDFDGSVGEWMSDNLESGKPFTVFQGQPCSENDITFDDNGLPNIQLLMSLQDGEFYITETPAEPTTVLLVVSLVLSVASVLLTPKPDLPDNVSRSQQSPNNELSARSNKARPLQRIPDIKGQVKSIPDIISPPYSTYEFNTEIEHGFYCVGRKQYQIEELKDGDTPIELIVGASAGVYYPFNSPNLGVPDISINNHFSEQVVSPYRSNQVNGITLGTEFSDALLDATKLRMTNRISGIGPTLPDLWIGNRAEFSPSYQVGTDVILENVFVNAVDVSGSYEILNVVDFGQAIDPQFRYWLLVDSPDFGIANIAQPSSGEMKTNQVSEYTDWAYMTAELFNTVIVNVIAPNGMYKDTGLPNLELFEVEYEIQIEGVDVDGVPDGNLIIINDSIFGKDQLFKGETTQHTFTVPTRFRQRAKRTTPKFTGSASVVDTIKLEDVFGLIDIDADDFGDVTTIQTRTEATPFATAVKERQLNCIATELVDEYLGSGVFAGVLTPNKRAAQSFIKDAIDPVIGNRTLDEIEADDLLALDAEINSYFGNAKMGEFSYTFDSTDITFQDYAQTLFNAVFCIAFREGGKISAMLEKAQTVPAMLFTHRSKQPNSETHTRNFNPATINDGVEFTYVDPVSNTSEVIYIPENKSAVNPKKYDIAGIRSQEQALVRARREYQKLLHQKTSIDVTLTAEGRYIKPLDMVAIVKGTRVKTFDGEVIGQDGLTLTLSADIEFGVGTHTIVLKDETGATESIEVTAGATSSEVILAGAPTQTIRTGIDSRRTEFSFGAEAVHLAERWLTQEVDISDKWFVNYNAINYSEEYYSQDGVPVRAFSSGFSNGFS